MKRQRILAALIDLAISSGWAAVVLGILAALAAWQGVLATAVLSLSWHATAAVLIVVPVIFAAEFAEASSYQATPGKRLLGLRVVTQTQSLRVTRGRALARNAIKYGPTLLFGYLVVLVLTTSAFPFPAEVWVLLAAAAVVLAAPVVGVVFGPGIPLHDLICELRVTSNRARRAAIETAVQVSSSSSAAAPRRAL